MLFLVACCYSRPRTYSGYVNQPGQTAWWPCPCRYVIIRYLIWQMFGATILCSCMSGSPHLQPTPLTHYSYTHIPVFTPGLGALPHGTGRIGTTYCLYAPSKAGGPRVFPCATLEGCPPVQGIHCCRFSKRPPGLLHAGGAVHNVMIGTYVEPVDWVAHSPSSI